MLPPAADRPKLQHALDRLAAAVEELLLGGLTTASEATRQSINQALQEAARHKLLRFGATVRTVADDLNRFGKQDQTFSRRRFAFFLNRSWIMARGLSQALQTGDESLYARLAWVPRVTPLPRTEVVCLGVSKKVTVAVVIFDFRLRTLPDGKRLMWSAVFPVKPGLDIPPEGYLHLPQKQKFNPTVFLDGKAVTVTNATLAADDSGGGRLGLTDTSTVVAGKPFADWTRFLDWTPQPAADRVAKHIPGPLDLENELQEEVVLKEYVIGTGKDGDEPGQMAYPITAHSLDLHAVVGGGLEGKALKKNLDDLRKRKRNLPPLFGLMHYERCRLVFQPLATFADGPTYLPLLNEVINKAALLKAMSFT